jgi:hypothetical protein
MMIALPGSGVLVGIGIGVDVGVDVGVGGGWLLLQAVAMASIAAGMAVWLKTEPYFHIMTAAAFDWHRAMPASWIWAGDGE